MEQTAINILFSAIKEMHTQEGIKAFYTFGIILLSLHNVFKYALFKAGFYGKDAADYKKQFATINKNMDEIVENNLTLSGNWNRHLENHLDLDKDFTAQGKAIGTLFKKVATLEVATEEVKFLRKDVDKNEKELKSLTKEVWTLKGKDELR